MKKAWAAFRKYFIPHTANGHKPHILRVRTIVFVMVIALVVESAFLYGSATLAPRSRLFGIIFTNTLVDETNQNRTTNGLQPLTVDPLLQAAAQDKANDMAANNYFAHTSPAGLTPWYWFAKVGYSFDFAGENLAVNFSDSEDVTNAWMNSPEHRANILNADFTQIGMATAQGTYNGRSAVYVVELFGTPAPAAPPADAIPFINSAAAAAPAPASANPASSNATPGNATHTVTKKPQATTKASVKPITKTPADTTQVLTVMATSDLQTASSNETFVAVKGASAVGNVSPAQPGNQSNFVQSAAANPRQIVDYIYLAIIALFALALVLNIFIKIRIQHPQVILGGMMVILVAGLFIVLNQHLLLASAIL